MQVQWKKQSVFIIGESMHGKTELATALLGLQFGGRSLTYPSELHELKLESQGVNLWDFGGARNLLYNNINQLFLESNSIFLLVVSAEYIYRNFYVEAWYEFAKSVPGSRIIPVMTHCDVDAERLKIMMRHYSEQLAHLGVETYPLQTSARTGQGIAELKVHLNQLCSMHNNGLKPSDEWLTLLNNFRSRKNPIILLSKEEIQANKDAFDFFVKHKQLVYTDRIVIVNMQFLADLLGELLCLDDFSDRAKTNSIVSTKILYSRLGRNLTNKCRHYLNEQFDHSAFGIIELLCSLKLAICGSNYNVDSVLIPSLFQIDVPMKDRNKFYEIKENNMQVTFEFHDRLSHEAFNMYFISMLEIWKECLYREFKTDDPKHISCLEVEYIGNWVIKVSMERLAQVYITASNRTVSFIILQPEYIERDLKTECIVRTIRYIKLVSELLPIKSISTECRWCGKCQTIGDINNIKNNNIKNNNIKDDECYYGCSNKLEIIQTTWHSPPKNLRYIENRPVKLSFIA